MGSVGDDKRGGKKMGMTEYEKERRKILLKPCPFCGGEARLKKHQTLEQTWYVQCKNCGVRTINSVQAPYESWRDAMNYPVKLWNRRIEDASNQSE